MEVMFAISFTTRGAVIEMYVPRGKSVMAKLVSSENYRKFSDNDLRAVSLQLAA
jgi:hypothetical protein